MRYPDLALQLQLSSVSPQKTPLPEISHQPPEHTSALYVYGLAKPSHRLLGWLEASPRRHLIFLEDQMSTLAAFYEASFLSHPQIHLRWAVSPRAWDSILEACSAQFSYEQIEIIPVKSSPTFRKIQESLLRRTLLWHSVTSEEISGHLLYRNLIENAFRLPGAFYMNATPGAWKKTPMILCGAGPSLELVAEDLRKVQDRALIVGCGSGLSALSHLGIRPHFGIASDPNPREYDCLKGCAYTDLPLLFTSRLYPKVFELFKGPYGYIRCGSGGPLEQAIETELGLSEPFLGQDLGREALSVTTLAVSLARFWGCNPIILAGIDLAFTDERHYAQGVLADLSPITTAFRRKNRQGKQIPTTLAWIMERDTLDAYARHHSDTAFFSTSPTGLKFSHIPYRTLEEILCDFPRRAFCFTGPKIETTPEHSSSLFSRLQASLERCLPLLLNLEQETSGSGKAILYESELELEQAYELLLKPPRRSFERLGEPGTWKFLIEVSRCYLAALK